MAAWMGAIDDSVKVHEITMPGSHDAGVSKDHNSPCGMGGNFATSNYICQNFAISSQLDAGSRFFDVRFALKGQTAHCLHAANDSTILGGGWGEDAATMFKGVQAFLENNPMEIVFLRISHTPEDATKVVMTQQKLHLKARQTFSPLTQVNIAKQTLGVLRGRAVVAYGSHKKTVPVSTSGQIVFSKSGAAGLVTCGEYANSNDMTTIVYKQAKRLNEHKTGATGGKQECGKALTDHLFMVYWQMTGGNVETNTAKGCLNANTGTPPNPPGSRLSAPKLDCGTHYNLRYWLNALEGYGGTKATSPRTFKDKEQALPNTDANRILWTPNIISMDFVNEGVCDAIVDYTYKALKAGGKTVGDRG